MHETESTNTEAEFVERVRRGIARYDRLRRALVVLYGVLALALLGLLVAVSEFIRGGQWPGLGPGFGVGLVLGSSLGLLAIKIAHGLVSAFCQGGRTERLLVKYYDAVRDIAVEQGAWDGAAERGAAADGGA
jgi:hypothetical protein